MASEYTKYYNLDLYTDTDKPNLRDQYNGAINKIDQQMYTNAVNITASTNIANNAIAETNELAKKVTTNTSNIAANKTIIDGLGTASTHNVTNSITSGSDDLPTSDSVNTAITESANNISAKVDANTTNIAANTERANNISAKVDANTTNIAANKASIDALGTASTHNVTNSITSGSDDLPTSDAVNSALASFVSNINGTELIVIGDSVSYGTGTTNAAMYSYPVILASKLGMNLHNYAENNAGFVANGTGTHKANFVQQITLANNDTTFNNDDVAIVLIMGGCNDSASNLNISENVKTCITNALTYFKNAQIIVIPYFWGATPVRNTSGYNFFATMDYFNTGVNSIRNYSNRVRIINHAWEWMAGKSSYMNDFIHPNDTGANYLANTIYGAIISGTDMRPYLLGGASGVKTNNLDCVAIDGIVTIKGNITTKGSSAYKPVITLPEWCKCGGGNFHVSCLDSSGWSTSDTPLYFNAGNGTIDSPYNIEADKTIYICNITFPLNV